MFLCEKRKPSATGLGPVLRNAIAQGLRPWRNGNRRVSWGRIVPGAGDHGPIQKTAAVLQFFCRVDPPFFKAYAIPVGTASPINAPCAAGQC
ncbi:hypothetical protein AWT69_003176 [Pseudomonas putida]|nr:hypothetical protein AWT69_003176 [Pseudomonas putida]